MNPAPPVSLWPDPDALGTLTDLYELTMMAGYYSSGMAAQSATFELFVRSMPAGRAYLVFAGLEQAIGDLLKLAFTPEQIETIRQWPEFRQLDESVIDALASLRFRGRRLVGAGGDGRLPGRDAAAGHGTIAAGPMGRNASPGFACIPDLGRFQGAREWSSRQAGRSLFEFGARRGHGPHGGNAGRACGLHCRLHRNEPRRGRSPPGHSRQRDHGPLMGPVVRAPNPKHSRRSRACSRKTRPCWSIPTTRWKGFAMPRRSSRRSGRSGSTAAIWPASQKRPARSSINSAGRRSRSWSRETWTSTRSLGSWPPAAPVDGFGVGTELITSRDAPALAMVYKLVELERERQVQAQSGQADVSRWPSRSFGAETRTASFVGDHVTRAEEIAEGEPLLVEVVRSGRLVRDLPGLEASLIAAGTSSQRCRRGCSPGRSAGLSHHLQ